MQEYGPPATKIDLLVLGEGYPAGERNKFKADLQHLTAAFFQAEPFASRRADWNVRGLHVPSVEAGISKPRSGEWRATPLGLSFNAFDSERYVLTYANRTIREAAAQVPYDTLILLFNDSKYGGGGIFHLWSTVSAGSGEAEYLFLHEFGHFFAGLADDYYTSQVSYEEMPAKTGPMLQAESHYGQVGAFEGGGYRAKGIYRSELDCIMFTRNPKHFCRVCSRGLERVMDLYAR